MAFTEAKYGKQLAIAKLKLDEILELSGSEFTEDVSLAYNQIGELIKRLEMSKDGTSDCLIDADKDLEYIKQWNADHKEDLQPFRHARYQIKQKIDEFAKEKTRLELEKQLYVQQKVSEEQTKLRLRQQKEIEEAAMLQQKREEDWYMKKLDFEKQIGESQAEHVGGGNTGNHTTSTQSVKLQKYTITPFSGDYKDWLRFWNQFTVEVDGSSISNISKFNYLLELVRGKPKDDILGLPHSEDGYEEAKRILEQTYGKDIKVHKALIKELEELPPIYSTHRLNDIHQFYNKLSRVVRTLVTMKRLTSAQSLVYTLMDKLGPVREVLVQKDDDWEEWGLEELVENLRKYVERNPLRDTENTSGKDDASRNRPWRRNTDKEKMLFGNNGKPKQGKKPSCVYCSSNEHVSHNCTKVLDIAARRAIIHRNGLCYNCTGSGHGASQCRSRGCRNCDGKHHTSICDRMKSTTGLFQDSRVEKSMSALMGHASTLHPTVQAKVGPETVRVMFDSGAGSSYLCTDVITKLNLTPTRREQRCIEQMFGTTRRNVEVYNITIQSLAVESFSFEVECINAEKDVLTYLPNPNVTALKKQYGRLRRLNFSEEETRDESMPVHIILGAADYQRIRTTEPLILGADPDKDPGAEFTMLGWTIYGRQLMTESGAEKQFFLKSGQEEFEKLCSLDVLGIADRETKEDSRIHEDFLQQLTKTPDGHYETKLPWKADHVALPSNKSLSAARLNSTVRRLERTGKLQEYHQIMQDQISNGIMEQVPAQPTGEIVHYVPHQAVVREQAETTKMRIVYDCSSRANAQSPSLNDCLDTGPPLQPLLFDIMLRNRMRKYCVTGDIQKAFLQIRVHEQDRDAQRVLWLDNLIERNVKEYRFTRVIFGATSSPYILGATLQRHVQDYMKEFTTTAESLLEDTYVDDIQGGGATEEEAAKFKEESIKILSEGAFTSHKRHSNVKNLNSEQQACEEETYAKSLVGNRVNSTTKILGTPWDKQRDTLRIDFETCFKTAKPLTKRKMISVINSVYDVLGWSAPVTITAKLIFSEVCLLKLHWDQEVPSDIQRKWEAWQASLRKAPSITVPRCIFKSQGNHFEIHGFADASKVAVCASIYVVTYQDSTPVDQNLLVAKSRVAPKEMSIPRLELVAAHSLAKLQNNVSKALMSIPITAYHNWVDSVTVLCWLANRGEWSTFVRNRVKKIGELTEATWSYVPTNENPSDFGTRGTASSKIKALWFKGPSWLSDESNRPLQPTILETNEVKAEKSKKEAMLLTEETTQENVNSWAEELLNRFSYWKLLRITAYMKRFINGCRRSIQSGPITKSEISEAEEAWIQITQNTGDMATNLQLAKDEAGLTRCYGRIQGYSPIFIPRKSTLARRIIEHCHTQMLHGGVSATMSKVRQKYWIPKLRSLVKSVRYNCNHCKRYRVKVLRAPPTSTLPLFRTEFTEPFSVTGVDFAGPLLYKSGKSETDKAYVALFTCASTRAVHLRLCKDMTAEEFKRGLKEFVARRGSPSQIVSDNAKTFQATKKWLTTLRKDEDIFNYLATKHIEWKFNLARAPWWGGFFERLVGIMKNCLSKAIGRALLKYEELEEVLLDVETFLNNRPLCYMEEEFEQAVITPNLLLRGQPAHFLEENRDNNDDEGLDAMTRRFRYLKKCRENVRKRWLNEYLRALQERINAGSTAKHDATMNKGAIVLLKDSTKNRANWKIGRIVEPIVGKDNVTRGYKILTGKGYVIERPLQLVCDLEISCDCDFDSANGAARENPDDGGNKQGRLVNRPGRQASRVATDRLVGVIANENEED